MTGTDLCEICVQISHSRIPAKPGLRPKPNPATHFGTDADGRQWRACWPHHEVLSAWMWASIIRKKMTDD